MARNPGIPLEQDNRYRCLYGPTESPSWLMYLQSSGVSPGGPHAYKVYRQPDFDGGVPIATGTMTVSEGGHFTIPPPGGRWPGFGNYRAYIPTIGWSVNFTILPADDRFPNIPTDPTPHGPEGDTDPRVGPQDAHQDWILRGLGYGPARLSIKDYGTTKTLDAPLNLVDAIATVAHENDYYLHPDFQDPVHPRTASVLSFGYPPGNAVPVSGGFDKVPLLRTRSDNSGLYEVGAVFRKTYAPGTDLWVRVVAGTASGVRIEVAEGSTSNTVETYDNLADMHAAQAAAAGSTRVLVTKGYAPEAPNAGTAWSKIPRAGWDTTVAATQAAYAAGVRWMEGPWNEPEGTSPWFVAAAFNRWAAAAKAGAPQMKCMGLNPVAYNALVTQWSQWMPQVLPLLDKALIDGWSEHAYHTTWGVPALTRTAMQDRNQLLAAAGFPASLPKWQTEQGAYETLGRGNSNDGGLGISRKAVGLYMPFLIQQEQHGTPLERNCYWYDRGDQDWPVASVHARFSQSLNPVIPAMHQLVRERWGKRGTGSTPDSANYWADPIDFGDWGNDRYVGSAYRQPGTGPRDAVLVLTAPGLAGDGRVTLTATGSGSSSELAANGTTITATLTAGSGTLLVLDVWGNPRTLAVADGVAELDVPDAPVYVRAPAGTTVAVQPFPFGADLLEGATVTTSHPGRNAQSSARICQPGHWSPYYWSTSYEHPPGTAAPSAPWQSAQPISTTGQQTITATLPAGPATVNTITLDAHPLVEELTSLLDFDVQTNNGTGWSTAPGGTWTYEPTEGRDYLVYGASDLQTPAPVEWIGPDKWQWVFRFPERTASAVRVVVRGATCGGSPNDELAAYATQSFHALPAGSDYVTVARLSAFNAVDDVTTPPMSRPVLRFGGKVLLRPPV